MKNNVTRLLDQKKVNYTVFELPPEKLGAEVTAERLGVPPEIVFKTIVVKRDGRGKPILAVVPGDREVDLKKLAVAVGEKKVFLTTQNEAETLTSWMGDISINSMSSRLTIVSSPATREVTRALTYLPFSFTGALAWAIGCSFSSNASRNLTSLETLAFSTVR